jgi:AcrR family transcriptional regulator
MASRIVTGKLTAEHWIDAAISRLVRGGIDTVGVQQLARDLGVTKGSFYWHFRDRKALLEAMLDRWRGVTIELNRLLENEEPEASGRLFRLLRLPGEIPAGSVSPAEFELAVRSWARHSPRAASMVRRVDKMREKVFVRMFVQLGASGPRALALARICAAIAGRLWRWEDVRGAQREYLINTAHVLLTGACRSKPARRR